MGRLLSGDIASHSFSLNLQVLGCKVLWLRPGCSSYEWLVREIMQLRATPSEGAGGSKTSPEIKVPAPAAVRRITGRPAKVKLLNLHAFGSCLCPDFSAYIGLKSIAACFELRARMFGEVVCCMDWDLLLGLSPSEDSRQGPLPITRYLWPKLSSSWGQASCLSMSPTAIPASNEVSNLVTAVRASSAFTNCVQGKEPWCSLQA